MRTPIADYLAADHDRLDALLNDAGSGDAFRMEPYIEFRRGILRHIGIEEKILLPAIMQMQGGAPSADAERLRLDHGAIVALLVPPPTDMIIRTLRHILGPHNEREEAGSGVYRALDGLYDADLTALVERMKATGDVPVMPFNARPDVLDATRRALTRAGYHFQE